MTAAPGTGFHMKKTRRRRRAEGGARFPLWKWQVLAVPDPIGLARDRKGRQSPGRLNPAPPDARTAPSRTPGTPSHPTNPVRAQRAA